MTDQRAKPLSRLPNSGAVSGVATRFALVVLSTSTWGGLFYLETSNLAILAWTVAVIGISFVRFKLKSSTRGRTVVGEAQKAAVVWIDRGFLLICAMLPWVVFEAATPAANLAVLWWFCVPVAASAGVAHVDRVEGPSASVPLRGMVLHCLVVGLSIAACMGWSQDSVHAIGAVSAILLTCLGLYLCVRRRALQLSALQLREENAALADKLVHQMELANLAVREKSRFLSAAAHDLRQPLQALCLLGASLRPGFSGTALQGEFLQMLRSIDSLSQSLDGMLDISYLDETAVRRRIRPIPVAHIFASLDSNFAMRAEEKGLDLRFRGGAQWVETDPVLLERLLNNLVENAIKYTSGGAVLVTARARNDSELWIEVRDSGPGIAAALQESVFEEYFQVNSAAVAFGAGQGIGLAVVRRLAMLLDLRVVLRSDVGRGSTFRVICRRGAPVPEGGGSATERMNAEELPLLSLGGAHVLIVDDEQSVLDAMKGVLLGCGACVSVASAPDAAIELARRQSFDAAIIDYRLGSEMDGLELALEIQKVVACSMPFLVVTGDTDPADIQRLHESGATVCFKPVSSARLCSELGRILGGTKSHMNSAAVL